MRCNWQSLARSAQSALFSPARRFSSSPTPSLLATLAHAPRTQPSTFPFFSPVSLPPPPTPVPPPLPTSTTTRLSTNTLTAAEISRCLSKLVRISIRQNNIEDAYWLVKLVTKPHYRSQIFAEHPTLSTLFQHDPDIKISPRLVSHTLLHELIRRGHVTEAYRVARGIMTEQIPLRSSSLQATVQAISKVPVDSVAPTKLHIVDDVSSVTLAPESAAKGQTRAVITLLRLAERSKNSRAYAMFEMLLTLSFINGEIIVASLIFGYFAKNWKAKETIDAQSSEFFDSSAVASDDGLDSAQITKPSTLQLFTITRAINRVISKDGRGQKFDNEFHKALQALVNVAWLLDRRLIPHDDIAFLVRTMYACPKVKSNVWILDKNNEPQKVQAYKYLHDVLSRLIRDLPKKPPDPRYDHGVMPPLNINSYNALLHYALRHRLSPALANQILDHMATQRAEPLPIDVTTVNIILTSGKLMRRPDIVNQALVLLKLPPIAEWKNALTEEKTLPLLKSSLPRSGKAERFNHTLQRSIRERIDSCALLPSHLPTALAANTVSLSEYLSCTRSSGNPQAIVSQLFKILPGLRTSEIPEHLDLPFGERYRNRKLHVRKALQRASKLGPYVFTELLNCLLKAGKIGMMRWVFNWARKAEKWSWNDPTSQAWILPIHAYTIMVEGYATLIRRQWITRLDKQEYSLLKNELFKDPDAPSADQQLHKMKGTPRQVIRKRGFIARNMAQWIRSLSMRQGLLLKKHIGSSQDIQKSKQLQKLVPPKADARFYNALLAVHGRSSGMPTRRAVASRSRCRRSLRLRMQRSRDRPKPRPKDPALLSILVEMLKAGFSIPLGLRPMFAGILKPSTLTFEAKRGKDRTPRAFPDAEEKDNRSLYYIPVAKTKGLPGW